MVNQAYISFITETGGGFDGHGNPISPTKTKATPIACNLEVISRQYEIIVNGQATQARYSAIVDVERMATVDVQTCKEIELLDTFNVSIGTFQMQNKEYLKWTNRWKFVV